MIIDTHSHLNFKAYDKDREEVIKRTQKEGLICIDIGTKYETSKKAVELAEKNENIFAAIGMHPIHIKTDLIKLKTDDEEGSFKPLGEEFDKEKYRELAKSNKVVAIGEIGIDYYYRPKGKEKLEKFKELQKQIFIQQLDLAEESNLPVIIHCRMAHEDVLQILKLKSKIKGVIHCFTGSLEQAKEYINLGFYLGINGIIYKMDLSEVIKNISLENLLVETDCPYLTPFEEGKNNRNEPIFIKYIIQKIADIKNIDFETVAKNTFCNAQNLFKIG